MKLKTISNYLVSLILLLAFILASCDGNDSNQSQESIQEASEETDKIKNTAPQYFYINSGDNKALSEIIDEQNVLALHGENHELIGELKGVKRKYYDANDQHIYSVKFKPDGSFKLRDADEKMKWKVKLDADKIKVSNNEEMENAYKIQIYDNGKLKVKREEEELEAIRFSLSETNLKLKDKYVVRNFGSSTALGILLIDDIPEVEKYIICAELLKAKR